MKKRIIPCTLVPVLLLLTQAAYALEETEVDTVLEQSGREAVSGNLLIWILCTVAFLKVSQKIDSYLSALGVNVGRTGSSMISEQMLIGRVFRTVSKGAGGAVGSILGRSTVSAPSGTAGPGPGPGIAAGMAGPAAASMAGKTDSLSALAGGAVLSASMKNGGRFASGVIGGIATGRLSSSGPLTGPKAAQALSCYLGCSVPDGASAHAGGEPVMTDAGSCAQAAAVSPHVPAFRDVELGGGRITGCELSPDSPQERQFAMYHAGQYLAPSGPYETVQTADGESWYRQYAQPAVRKTPYQDASGSIRYHEEIVSELPEIPKRKDRV